MNALSILAALPMLVPFAARSLLRNRRRSAVTLAAIGLGVAIVVFLHGFGAGLVDLVVRNTVDMRTGAIQVHRAGWLDARQTAPLTLDLGSDVLESVRRVPGVRAAAPRIPFGGLVSNGGASALVSVDGVDPALEPTVCPGRATELAKGALVSTDTPRGAVLGAGLAEALGVEPGASLTLSAATRSGAQNALDLDVVGLTRGAAFLEAKRVVVVPLAYAQELLGMEGRFTEIAVGVSRLEETEAVRRAVAQRLAALPNDGVGFEVHTWMEVMPFLRDAVARLRLVLAGLFGVLFFIVVFGVINTMLMNVHERVREIGTLLAIGWRRAHVLALFLIEAALLGVLGGFLGGALGLGVTAILETTGLPLTPPGSFPQILRPEPQIGVALAALGVALFGALFAAAWPARRASRLSPVEALRTV